MRVVVTGGAGCIGAYVVQELAHVGHVVTSFDRTAPNRRVPGVHYRIGDHENLGEIAEVCAGANAIAHLSAIPAPRTFPDTTVFRTNVMGTFNVHEAAVLMDVPLVVSTSSQSAYGFAWHHRPFLPHYLPLDEDHPDLSQDAYGLSKMVGEEIAHGYHRRCDLRVCSLRPPWVVIPEDYERSIKPGLTTQPNLQAWMGTLFTYVDVRDLAVAYRMVIEAPAVLIQDEVFNVAADDALVTEPLAEVLPRLDPAFASLTADLTGNQPMVSAERIKQRVGWRPQFSWRSFITV